MSILRPSTQDAIIEAAFLLYRENPSASLGDIAKRAGIGRATLHRHFSSRDDLIIALAKTAADELDAAAEQAAEKAESHTEALKLMLYAMVPLSDRAWFLYREAAEQDPEIKKDYEQQKAEMAELIDAAKQEGGLAPDQPTTWIAHSYEALLFAAWEMVRAEEATVKQAADMAWQSLMYGVSAQGAQDD